jgi:GTP-binding protein Era
MASDADETAETGPDSEPADRADRTAHGDNGSADEPRVGFCAILGLPNVGKSTLLNRILGLRLTAVSRKPQTTRNRILGVHNADLPGDGPAQIIFVDTPGIQRGPGALRQYMRDQALGAVGDSDVALLLVDAADPRQRDPARLREPDARDLTRALDGARAPVLLGLNKIDKFADKEALLPVMAAYGEAASFTEILPISAHTGAGVDDLVASVGRHLPRGPRLFPEDMVTDRAERFLAGELIREQLFRQLGQELPYATAVVVESLRERRVGPARAARKSAESADDADVFDIVVEAVIYVERDSQKGIVIGKGGRRIKEIGQRARAAIGHLLGCEVHVRLRVKVAPGWSRAADGIRRLGYE